MKSDDWKDEINERMNKSAIYKSLKAKCSAKDHKVLALVNEACEYSYHRTKTILKHMGEFTIHDSDHSFRVIYLMERLLGAKNIQHLSPPELMLLILSAFFHDMGMAPNEKEIITWKKTWDSNPIFKTKNEKEIFEKFNRFYFSKPDQQEIINDLTSRNQLSKADIIKSYLISEYIRSTHSDRVREIIHKDWNNKIIFRDCDLTVELANLCESHDDDALKLLDLDKSYLCAPNTYVCLPLIGVMLRLADILDFDSKRTPTILFSHLYVRHPVSLVEWNKHRAVEAWDISPDTIQFSAKCSHPAIQESINRFCDMIDHELSVCNNIIFQINDYNKGKNRKLVIKFPFKVDRKKIETKKNIYNQPQYLYWPTKFTLSKQQVVDLLMGTKLYGDTDVALRELLQNSIDACLLRQAQEKKWGNPYIPVINVKYYTEDGEEILEVDDNGTGMDHYIIDKYYSNIGSSFYKSIDFYNLKAESNAEFTPTSRFGIGILSCFMVADTLCVDTKRVYANHMSSDSLNIIVEGQESIFLITPGKRELPGTTTKLYLRKTQNPWEKMTENEFIDSVEEIIPNPPFKINIQTLSQNKSRDENSFKLFDTNSLKDYTWRSHENIREFNISFNEVGKGFVGHGIVAILETQGEATDDVDIHRKEIEIDGNKYDLKKKILLKENKIWQESSSISISDDGEITEDSSSTYLAKSKSMFSLHGIEIPTSLFPDSWTIKKNQACISWPFPLILVLDVCGTYDLDLNSSRTQVIISDKWMNFEEELAFSVCQALCLSVSKDYWKNLKRIFIQNTKNPRFLRSLRRVKFQSKK